MEVALKFNRFHIANSINKRLLFSNIRNALLITAFKKKVIIKHLKRWNSSQDSGPIKVTSGGQPHCYIDSFSTVANGLTLRTSFIIHIARDLY